MCTHKKHNDSMMGKVHVEICMLSNKNNSHTIFMEAPTNRNTKLTPPTPFPSSNPAHRASNNGRNRARGNDGIVGKVQFNGGLLERFL